jgi:hypothetical protein
MAVDFPWMEQNCLKPVRKPKLWLYLFGPPFGKLIISWAIQGRLPRFSRSSVPSVHSSRSKYTKSHPSSTTTAHSLRRNTWFWRGAASSVFTTTTNTTPILPTCVGATSVGKHHRRLGSMVKTKRRLSGAREASVRPMYVSVSFLVLPLAFFPTFSIF